MNWENFLKWLREQLVPGLPSNSVVCLDNAPYDYSMTVNKAPTTSSRKGEIQDWLSGNNVYFDNEMIKSELLCLVKRYRNEPEYVVDNILKEHGHEVLRIPRINVTCPQSN